MGQAVRLPAALTSGHWAHTHAIKRIKKAQTRDARSRPLPRALAPAYSEVGGRSRGGSSYLFLGILFFLIGGGGGSDLGTLLG